MELLPRYIVSKNSQEANKILFLIDDKGDIYILIGINTIHNLYICTLFFSILSVFIVVSLKAIIIILFNNS